MRLLVVVETLFVASFVVMAALALRVEEHALPPIDVAALSVGEAEERWTGIFIQERHVGFAVAREAPTADGGRVYSQQSSFSLQAMGTVQKVTLVGSAVTAPDGTLRQFDFMLSSPLPVVARGVMDGNVLRIELVQGGTATEMTVPMDEPPVMALTMSAQLRGRELAAGDTFEVPYFDPIMLSNTRATVRIDAPETLPNGEAGWWITSTAAGVETRRLVDANGETIREESGTGLSTQRMTREEAMAVDGEPPPDLVAMAAVPLDAPLDESKPIRVLAVRVGGVEATRFAADPPLQVIADGVLTVSVPLVGELPTLPVQGDHDIEPTATLPATHPELVERALAVVGDAPDRLVAARRLHEFVYGYVQKVPTIGVPNGLEVLHQGRGDCNEHTALYVSLARAAGIPSRIAAGLVYSSRTGGPPAFYYHAWPEVQLGGPTDWVPIDPTLGQFPADATHLKIVNGDLDRQVEIMSLLGRVRLSLVEAR